MDVATAAKKWGLSERTVKKAVKEKRIRSEGSGPNLTISDDEIAPMREKDIQGFLWVILRAKNDPSWRPDTSCIQGINDADVMAVFRQLLFRQYLDMEEEDDCLESSELYLRCRVTEKGFALTQKKKLPGSIIGNELMASTAKMAFEVIIQSIVRLYAQVV